MFVFFFCTRRSRDKVNRSTVLGSVLQIFDVPRPLLLTQYGPLSHQKRCSYSSVAKRTAGDICESSRTIKKSALHKKKHEACALVKISSVVFLCLEKTCIR